MAADVSATYAGPEPAAASKEPLLTAGLSVARALVDPAHRAEALARFSARLSGAERDAVAREALAIAISTDHASVAKVIQTLSPHLSETLLGDARAAAGAIEPPARKAEILAGLAAHLSGDERAAVVDEALAAARTIADNEARSKVLVDLVRHLPKARRDAVLDEALAAIRTITENEIRARALVGLVDHLPEARRAAVLDEARAAAGTITDNKARFHTLADLVRQIPETGRAAVLEEIVATAGAIADHLARFSTLVNLVHDLPRAECANLLREAYAAASRVGDAWQRTDTLTELIPLLPQAEREASRCLALASARAVTGGSRVSALMKVASHLPEAEREACYRDALAAGLDVEDDEMDDLLLKIAAELPRALLPDALAAARGVHDDWCRAKALIAFLPLLPATETDAVVTDVLAAVRTVDVEGLHWAGVRDICPVVAQPQLADVLAFARTIKDHKHRANALAEIAGYLPAVERGTVHDDALNAARRIDDNENRARVMMSDLAPRLQRRGERPPCARHLPLPAPLHMWWIELRHWPIWCFACPIPGVNPYPGRHSPSPRILFIMKNVWASS